MRKSFEYHDINEMGQPQRYIDGKAHQRFSYELRMLDETNPTLIANFMKVAKWIKKNCPKLNGDFSCRHNPFYKIDLIIKNGDAYLCTGSHSWGYSTYLSTKETAVYTQGSCQTNPYAFKNVFFFRNDRLEYFLSQWATIKVKVIAKNEIQNKVFSEDFIA